MAVSCAHLRKVLFSVDANRDAVCAKESKHKDAKRHDEMGDPWIQSRGRLLVRLIRDGGTKRRSDELEDD